MIAPNWLLSIWTILRARDRDSYLDIIFIIISTGITAIHNIISGIALTLSESISRLVGLVTTLTFARNSNAELGYGRTWRAVERSGSLVFLSPHSDVYIRRIFFTLVETDRPTLRLMMVYFYPSVAFFFPDSSVVKNFPLIGNDHDWMTIK